MNIKEVKILLIQKGLSIAEMARELEKDSNATAQSLETMISDTLYGRRYFVTVAKQLEEIYGIKIDRPAHLQPIRQQIKQAA